MHTTPRHPLHPLFSTLACAALSTIAIAGCDESPIPDEPDDAIYDGAPNEFAEPASEPTQHPIVEQDGMLIVSGGDFRVRIHRSRRVAELNVPRDQLANWYGRSFGRWSREASSRLYEVFGDDFDFIVFVPASEDQHIALTEAGESVRVRNDIEGLGLPLFDQSKYYGSDGRLQSTILMGGINQIVAGPCLREFGERWGNRLLPTASFDHFGFSDVGGQLGGCAPGEMVGIGHSSWQCDFNGTQDWSPDGAEQNDRSYAKLELYLMGLIGPENILPISFVADGKWLNPNQGIFTGTLNTAEVDDLRAIHGKRLPSHLNAQTEFRTLFVVLSGGEFIDFPLFHDFDNTVAEFATPKPVDGWPGMLNFHEATSGLASLDAEDLDASLL